MPGKPYLGYDGNWYYQGDDGQTHFYSSGQSSPPVASPPAMPPSVPPYGASPPPNAYSNPQDYEQDLTSHFNQNMNLAASMVPGGQRPPMPAHMPSSQLQFADSWNPTINPNPTTISTGTAQQMINEGPHPDTVTSTRGRRPHAHRDGEGFFPEAAGYPPLPNFTGAPPDPNMVAYPSGNPPPPGHGDDSRGRYNYTTQTSKGKGAYNGVPAGDGRIIGSSTGHLVGGVSHYSGGGGGFKKAEHKHQTQVWAEQKRQAMAAAGPSGGGGSTPPRGRSPFRPSSASAALPSSMPRVIPGSRYRSTGGGQYRRGQSPGGSNYKRLESPGGGNFGPWYRS